MNPADMWGVVSGGGALGLAIIFLYLFQTGKVRSEKQISEATAVYEEVIKHKDKEIEWWRAAYAQQVERGDHQEVVNRESMELAKTTLVVLKGVQSAAEKMTP